MEWWNLTERLVLGPFDVDVAVRGLVGREGGDAVLERHLGRLALFGVLVQGAAGGDGVALHRRQGVEGQFLAQGPRGGCTTRFVNGRRSRRGRGRDITSFTAITAVTRGVIPYMRERRERRGGRRHGGRGRRGGRCVSVGKITRVVPCEDQHTRPSSCNFFELITYCSYLCK